MTLFPSAAVIAMATASMPTLVFAQTKERVPELQTRPMDPTAIEQYVWYDWFTSGEGALAIVDLEAETGQTPTLVEDAPLPVKALKLTTEDDMEDPPEADRANAGLAILELAEDIFSNGLKIGYHFYKGIYDGPVEQNLNAAVALKMEIGTPDGSDFTTLVWEPYLNQPFPNLIPLSQWFDVSVDMDNGLWWSSGNGAFGTAGGCCTADKTLQEWREDFSTNDPTDWARALIISIQLGVGSSNIGQRGFADKVLIFHEFDGGLNVEYNFEDCLEECKDKDGYYTMWKDDDKKGCQETCVPEDWMDKYEDNGWQTCIRCND